MKKPARATFMTNVEIKAMGDLPRTHENCKARTGVARPGKTAKDRYTGHKA